MQNRNRLKSDPLGTLRLFPPSGIKNQSVGQHNFEYNCMKIRGDPSGDPYASSLRDKIFIASIVLIPRSSLLLWLIKI